MARATAAGARPRRRRRAADPVARWTRSLARRRPGLVDFTLDALASMYGRPVWRRRNDPTSELVLTILSQNSADVNAERAFESLRAQYPGASTAGPASTTGSAGPADAAAGRADAPPGWGGRGIGPGIPPDWSAVETAPLAELVDVIRPGGLAPQKAPRIQAALRALREARGDHSLEFLGQLPAAEAEAWLTTIPGIGRKTAAVVLLFCFGTPLMPVDRHVERVSKRVGLLGPKQTADQAHHVFLRLLEPDQVYEAHVNLIGHGRRTCHARRPECWRCAVAPRCRYVDPRAP
jgi:endonuclease-3